ncbi:septum formation initiator family protein [Spirochaetia bacterium 38H-sp]|uniref:Septum formation initiator family protein n=1 Tax=Rarispira pelagica TaxID=3141764 RepID=A0ABU9UD44_9SPIR
MKWRVVVSAYIGCLIYFIGLFIWGETGIISYNKLEKVHEAMSDNIVSLSLKNKQLEDKLVLLSTSSEQIKNHAKSLYLLEEDEGLILLKGISPPVTHMSPGTIIYPVDTGIDRTPFIRAVALSVGLIVFALSWILIPSVSPSVSEKRKVYMGNSGGFHSMRRASR